MRLLMRAALTMGGPSSIFRVSGFSTYTSLPALSASMATAACQWSGTPISTASTSRSEEHTSDIQSRQYLPSFPTRRSSDLVRRLFQVHVLARVERIDGNGGMPVVRHADQHGVHFLHLEQLAMVAEAFGVGSDRFGGVDLGAVNIAARRAIHGSGFHELTEVAAAALAATDDAELHALVGTVNTGVGKSSGGSHAAEKCPAWDIVFRHDPIIC